MYYCPIVGLDVCIILPHSGPGLYLDIASQEALVVCILVYVAFMALLHHAFHL